MRGAIGAIVLVDTAGSPTAFSALDYFERQGLPFIVAVNRFDGTREYVARRGRRRAWRLRPEVPIIRRRRPRP